MLQRERISRTLALFGVLTTLLSFLMPMNAQASERIWQPADRGHIEWSIQDKHLIIRPANGSESAVFWGTHDLNLGDAGETVEKISFEGTVEYYHGTNLFDDCPNLEELDAHNLRPSDFATVDTKRIRLEDFTHLQKIVTGDSFSGFIGPEFHEERITPLISSFPIGYWRAQGSSIQLPADQIPDSVANTYTFAGTEPSENTWYAAESVKWKVENGVLTIKRLDQTLNNTVTSSHDRYGSWHGSPWTPLAENIRSLSIDDDIQATVSWLCEAIISDESLNNLKTVDLHRVAPVVDTIDSYSPNEAITTLVTGPNFITTTDDGNFWLKLKEGYWESNNTGDLYKHDRIPSCKDDTLTYAGAEPSANTWVHSNTAMWGLFDGELIIKPEDGLETGELGYSGYSWEIPWKPFLDEIASVTIQETVHINPAYLFEGCSRLKSVDLSGLDITGEKSMNSMFSACPALLSVAFTGIDASSIQSIERMFFGAKRLKRVSFEGVDFKELENLQYAFDGCENIESISLHALRECSPTYINGLFRGCTKLRNIQGLDEIDTSNVKNMRFAFSDCQSLRTLDLSNWDTSNTLDMEYMFNGCSSLRSLDLSSFDTRNVVELEGFLPRWEESFTKLTVGPNFSFKGYANEANQVLLPQDTQWTSSADGRTYNWDSLPSCVAATYTRVQDVPNWSDFWDVDATTPHFSSIAWLSSAGISTGYPDGTFRPMADVVRQDMAAFIYRLCGEPEYTPSASDKARFSDVTESTPHAKEIWWLASTGISTGYPDGTFRPLATVVRQDMAAFLHRTFAQFGDGSDKPAGGSFPDVTADTPHAEDIRWLAANGISTGYPDGTFRPMASVVRQDMAAFLKRIHDLGV